MKNYCTYFKVILFLAIGSLCPFSYSFRYVRNLDQTFQILPQHLHYFSIANGAVLWETGWLNNVHQFDNSYPLKTTDRRGRPIIGYDKSKTDAINQLIHILFYRIPASRSYADFSTTDFIKTKDPHKIAALIAEIVVSLDSLSTSPEKNNKTGINEPKNSPAASLSAHHRFLSAVKQLLILSETKYLKIGPDELEDIVIRALDEVKQGLYPLYLVHSI